jgi:hypothetical protein
MLPTGEHKPEFLGTLHKVMDDLKGRPLDAALESRLNLKFGSHTHTYQELSRLLQLEYFPTVTGRALMMYFLPHGQIEYKTPPAEILA